MTEDDFSMRAVTAIRDITRETGYPPTPEELADALGVAVRELHSRLLPAKRAGLVRYDESDCYVVAA